MPYISVEVRNELALSQRGPTTAGELNYTLTKIVIAYIEERGLSYGTCNDIVGALENCKDEFQRRVQHPYEDKKIEANSDVYPKEFL